MSTQPIGAWGVEVTVPPEATSKHDAPNRHHWIQVPGAELTLRLFDRPAPSFDDALRSWKAGENLMTFGEGVTEHGAFYALHSFELVDGRSWDAQNFHFRFRVTRVHAILPIDDRHHVECTSYIDRSVAADDDTLAAVAQICKSLRRAR